MSDIRETNPFQSDKTYLNRLRNQNSDAKDLAKYDEFAKKVPGMNDQVSLQVGLYELMKWCTVKYANIFQKLRGKEELSTMEDMQLVLMPLCQSLYFEELPDLVFTHKFGTGKRERVSEEFKRDLRKEHLQLLESYRHSIQQASEKLEAFLNGEPPRCLDAVVKQVDGLQLLQQQEEEQKKKEEEQIQPVKVPQNITLTEKEQLLIKVTEVKNAYSAYLFMAEHVKDWELTNCLGKQEIVHSKCSAANQLASQERLKEACGCSGMFLQCLLVAWIERVKDLLVPLLERNGEQKVNRYWAHTDSQCPNANRLYEYSEIYQSGLRQMLLNQETSKYFSLTKSPHLKPQLMHRLRALVQKEQSLIKDNSADYKK